MSITSALRRARENAGISLRGAATTSGVGAGNLSAIERGLRDPTTATTSKIADAIGIRFIPMRPQGRSSAADAVETIVDAEAAGDPAAAYRALLQLADDLAAASAVDRLLLTVEEPTRTGSRWDDAVAGLAEWRLGESKTPVPEWVTARRGDAAETWEPQRSAFALGLRSDPDRVPEPLRRRGVLIEEAELASV